MLKTIRKTIADLQDLEAALVDAKVVVIERDYKELTRRELEVIRLLCDGCTSQEVADQLFLSARTVEAHRWNVLQKLHCKSLAQAIALLFKAEILK